MKLKKVILAILSLCVFLSLFSCSGGEVVIDGVTYHSGCASYIDGDGSDPRYILPEVGGKATSGLGIRPFMGSGWLRIGAVEKVYFPWTITGTTDIEYIGAISQTDDEGNTYYISATKYLISSSTSVLIDGELDSDVTHVVPRIMYYDYCEFDLTKAENVLPANISYRFNYEDAPNDGYFFVDLLEETGGLVKPPYYPVRDGFKFGGWYKDSACTDVFDFENEVINIRFDEAGNRIYEEIYLYALWK